MLDGGIWTLFDVISKLAVAWRMVNVWQLQYGPPQKAFSPTTLPIGPGTTAPTPELVAQHRSRPAAENAYSVDKQKHEDNAGAAYHAQH